MKIFKYFFICLSIFAVVSCEDDSEVFDEGNPLNRNIINLEGTVSTQTTIAGEGDKISFEATIPQTFESAVTVTARVRYDNGRTTLGSATIPAGSTSGTGSITLPGDDGASSGMLYGVPDFAKLELVGIQLADLEKGNTYTLTSNKTSFAIIDSTLGAAGGLNVLFDWEGAPSSDLDMYIYSADTFELYESAETGSRYEVDLFQNLNRPDGDYFIAVGVYSIGTDEPTRDLDYLFALTLPDGTVDIYTGTFEAAADGDFYFPVINFTKTTDEETGTVSYTTSQP